MADRWSKLARVFAPALAVQIASIAVYALLAASGQTSNCATARPTEGTAASIAVLIEGEIAAYLMCLAAVGVPLILGFAPRGSFQGWKVPAATLFCLALTVNLFVIRSSMSCFPVYGIAP